MKKSIIALFAAATMVAGVNAQDGEGGSGTTGIGGVSGGSDRVWCCCCGYRCGCCKQQLC